MKIIMINLLLFVFLLLCTIIPLEIYYRNFGPMRDDLQKNAMKPYIKELAPPLPLSHSPYSYEVKDNLWKTLSVGEFEFDSFGRRKTQDIPSAKKFALFFGGSYTFGSALKQNQILPHFYSEISREKVFVYARGGYSPSNMLYQISSIDISKQVPQNFESGNAFYFYYHFQWRRVLGTFGWIAKHGPSSPIYKWDSESKKLLFLGSFFDAYPLRGFLYYWLGKLHLSHYLLDFSPYVSVKHDSILFCSLFNESYKGLKESLGSRFNKMYIVVPLFKDSQKAKEIVSSSQYCLNKKIIALFFENKNLISESIIDPVFEYHPTEEYNKWLATSLYDGLKKSMMPRSGP